MLREEMAELSKTLKTVNTNVARLRGDVTGLHQDIIKLRQDVTELEALPKKLEDLPTNLGRFGGSLAQVRRWPFTPLCSSSSHLLQAYNSERHDGTNFQALPYRDGTWPSEAVSDA